MPGSVFDTLAFAKRLKAAGVPDALAEAQAEALADAVGTNLVTRPDLNEAVLKLESKMNIQQWMAGFNLALTVTILFKIFA